MAKTANAMSNSKLEMVTAEYNFMLTSILESQREFYDGEQVKKIQGSLLRIP